MSEGREPRPPPDGNDEQGSGGGKESPPPPPPTAPEPPDQPHHGGSGSGSGDYEDYEQNVMTTGFPPQKDPTGPKPNPEPKPKPEGNGDRKTTTNKPYNGSKGTPKPTKPSDNNQDREPAPEPDQAAQSSPITQEALIAIVAGLVILGIIIAIAVYLYWRKKSKSKRSYKEPMTHGSYKKTGHHQKTDYHPRSAGRTENPYGHHQKIDYHPRSTGRTENPYEPGNYYSSIQSEKMDSDNNHPIHVLSKGIDNPGYSTTYQPPLQSNAKVSSNRSPVQSNNTVVTTAPPNEEAEDIYLSIADSALDTEPPKKKHEYLEMIN